MIKRNKLGYKSPLAPIRIHKMPPEIPQHIFGLVCVENYVEGTGRYYFPLILSKVCSLWNGIVASLPRFWSTIDLRATGGTFRLVPAQPVLQSSKQSG